MASASARAELIGTIQTIQGEEIPLIELELIAPAGVVLENVVVDTGFGGALRVPSGFFRKYGLTPRGTTVVTLADGTPKLCPMASLTLQWMGQHRRVAALEFGPETLVGMELLNHSRIELGGVMLKLSRL
ncbi:MAG TPA: hypothetical protein VFA20_23135 [Myxococcaceae bacterium]|nr:hypothetical protein [Myxococcaceae bacterium]